MTKPSGWANVPSAEVQREWAHEKAKQIEEAKIENNRLLVAMLGRMIQKSIDEKEEKDGE